MVAGSEQENVGATRFLHGVVVWVEPYLEKISRVRGVILREELPRGTCRVEWQPSVHPCRPRGGPRRTNFEFNMDPNTSPHCQINPG